MITIDCFIQIFKKMEASMKLIYFFKILYNLNGCIQSNLQKKTTYMYANMTRYQKCVHINILTADFLIANIQHILIKLSMSQSGTINLNQTAELQCSAVEHPIRIIRESMRENHIVTISFIALKYTRYHITYLPKVGINLSL